MIDRSESINELAAALAKAQGLIQGAHKDARNPHFNSKYADLASVWDACRKPLSDNGLSIVQHLTNDGEGRISCHTMLLHSSGQFLSSNLSMAPDKNTPQAGGSCATYLRRYTLQAMVGVAPDDDDGNEASGKFQARLTPATGGSNDTGYTTRKTVAPAPISYVPPTQTQTQDTKPPETFSILNPKHKEYFDLFVRTHKAEANRDRLITAMTGKHISKANLESEWAKINPEAPDVPKED